MKSIVLFIFLISINPTYAQGLVDSFASPDLDQSNMDSSLVTEKIQKISSSKKIYILSNSNTAYNAGDYITIIFKSQMVVRAIVAKVQNQNAGVKIVKIYNENEWNNLTVGQEVQILRGDDSYYLASLKKNDKNDQEDLGSLLNDEDDLFNETTFTSGDVEIVEGKNRIIKPDNLFSGGIGAISINADDYSNASHFVGSWARQLSDNFWLEGSIGWSQMSDFPGSGIDTHLYTFTGRVKYTFSAPFYCYAQPYLGIQYYMPYSPGAGQGTSTTAAAEEELDAIERLKRFKPAFGVTVLKRLVPGWFIKGDIGTDGLYAGLALEF